LLKIGFCSRGRTKTYDDYIKKYELRDSDFKGNFVKLTDEHFPQM